MSSRWLIAVGALALSACHSSPTDRHLDDATVEQFQAYVDDLAHPRMEGRGAGYAGLDRARDYLVDYFTMLGLEPAFHLGDAGQPSYTQPFEIAYRPHDDHGIHHDDSANIDHQSPVLAHNVGGYLPGIGDMANQVVVIGAHYDHLGRGEIGSMAPDEQLRAPHHGADDNASGTAGLMLLAQRAVERAADEPLSDHRSLLFVGFSGEEWGLIGSMHLVNTPDELAVDFEQIGAMINLDMIGRLRDELIVFGVGSGDRWEELVARANAELRLPLRDAAGGIGLSDQTSFYVNQIPVLHLFTGMHEDYHRPSDTPDRINARGGARVVALADRLVRQLERDPQPLAFTGDPDADLAGGMQGLGRAQLGVMPDYATLDGEQGAGLTATRPGSPADRAGLEAGDVIKRWNDEPVDNVRALTRHLRAAEPGERVELAVERDGATRTITVELGSR